MTAKRLTARNEDGWPYYQRCADCRGEPRAIAPADMDYFPECYCDFIHYQACEKLALYEEAQGKEVVTPFPLGATVKRLDGKSPEYIVAGYKITGDADGYRTNVLLRVPGCPGMIERDAGDFYKVKRNKKTT